MNSTVVFGLVPALYGARRDVVTPLTASGRSTTGTDQARARGALVVTEVLLSVVLLVAVMTMRA